MWRITDFERETAAAKIMGQIDGAAALPDAERDALFAKIVLGEAQRVFNLMSHVARDLKQRAANPIEHAMVDFMEQVVELDSEAENGLRVRQEIIESRPGTFFEVPPATQAIAIERLFPDEALGFEPE